MEFFSKVPEVLQGKAVQGMEELLLEDLLLDLGYSTATTALAVPALNSWTSLPYFGLKTCSSLSPS